MSALAIMVAVLLMLGSAAMAQEAHRRRGQRIAAEGGGQAAPAPATREAPALSPASEAGEPTTTAPSTATTNTTATTGPRPPAASTMNRPPPSPATAAGPSAPPSSPGQGRMVPPGTDFYTSEPVSATDGRLRVSFRYFAPNRPVMTAQALKWIVNWDDGVGYISQIRISFGDGAEYVSKLAYSCFEGRDQSTMAHPSGVHDVPHAYRHAGRYLARAWVTTSSCSGGDATTEVSMSGPPIEAGATPSNGPDSGYVVKGVQSRPGDDPALFKLGIEAADSDGYVSRIELVWGDGAREVVEYPLSECVDPGSHWPSSFRRAEVGHRFATEDRAQHTVVVTSTSVGCDGANPQTVGGYVYSRTSQQW